MKREVQLRAAEAAQYILKTGATVRTCAEVFGVSKTTIHKDVTERLPEVNPALAAAARKVLDVNKSERHIRGGMATKEKYRRKNKKETPV
ncbi:MAG: sporulation transcriptional regulator SpoIIID [Clostridia bacterium]|nr:sporulation transcriptional regulator SpoIIID [Clostridia bacterium]